jgi:glutamyl-tRNA reductase
MPLSTFHGVSHTCFGLSYLLAFGVELLRLWKPTVGLRTVGLILGGIGLATHTLYLAFHPPAPAAPYGSMVLVAWVLAVFYFYGTVHHARRLWAVFVLPVVVGLVGLSLALIVPTAEQPVDLPAWLVGERAWGAVHGLLILGAAVGVSIAFLASVMYLLQANRLRAKTPLSPRFTTAQPGTARKHEPQRCQRGVPDAHGRADARRVSYRSRTRRGRVVVGQGPRDGRTVDGVRATAVHAIRHRRAAASVRRVGRAGLRPHDRRLGRRSSVRRCDAHRRSTGGEMNLRTIGLNFRTATVDVRERIAFPADVLEVAVPELAARYGCEAVILGTCNRVELYVARPAEADPLTVDGIAEYLGDVHRLPTEVIRPHLYSHANVDAVRHLFRVSSSLDSLILGEGQIAGQVKRAFETARRLGTTGMLLNTMFAHALKAAKRVRTETGISTGHVSVSSVAVDYVRQVFDHFDDKTVLVIGAGKMGRLTLNHLKDLRPRRILVTNRSPDKAAEVAAECGGTAVPWEKLDDTLAEADIVLSTTGAPTPIMPAERFALAVRPKRRSGRTLVVLDIAVPRDFDPAIHDGDRVCVFNIDDLTRVRDETLAQRQAHVRPAEALVQAEVAAFLHDWQRRKNGPVIQLLRGEADKLRADVVDPLLAKLDGKLTAAEKEYLAGAFKLFQNRLLHGPIAALQDASREETSHGTLIEAVKRLFRLGG